MIAEITETEFVSMINNNQKLPAALEAAISSSSLGKKYKAPAGRVPTELDSHPADYAIQVLKSGNIPGSITAALNNPKNKWIQDGAKGADGKSAKGASTAGKAAAPGKAATPGKSTAGALSAPGKSAPGKAAPGKAAPPPPKKGGKRDVTMYDDFEIYARSAYPELSYYDSEFFARDAYPEAYYEDSELFARDADTDAYYSDLDIFARDAEPEAFYGDHEIYGRDAEPEADHDDFEIYARDADADAEADYDDSELFSREAEPEASYDDSEIYARDAEPEPKKHVEAVSHLSQKDMSKLFETLETNPEAQKAVMKALNEDPYMAHYAHELEDEFE